MFARKIDYRKVDSKAYMSVAGMSRLIRDSGLESPLVELVRVRVSQMNGCAYCVDMHTQVARGAGETEQRLYCVQVWRESPFYTKREMLALELAESLAALGPGGVQDELFQRIRGQFSEREYVMLVMVVNEISSWNRLSIACGSTAGMYGSTEGKA